MRAQGKRSTPQAGAPAARTANARSTGRGGADRRPRSADDVLALQRQVGNRAVGTVLTPDGLPVQRDLLGDAAAAYDRASSAVSGVVDDVASWGAEQIEDAGQLATYITTVSESLAREMMATLAERAPQIVAAFVLAHPTHRLVAYAVSQLPMDEIVALALGAGDALQRQIVDGIRTLGEMPEFFEQLYQQGEDAAVALAQRLETQDLPDILTRCESLGYDLLYHWWPINTGFEAQVTLGAGVQVPVWPEPPIFVGSGSEFQGTVKVYNKSDSDSGAPKLEFEVGTQTQDTERVGVTIPGTASVDSREQETLARTLKATTWYSEIDWNTGLIEALRNSDRETAYAALCRGLGNVMGATQFGIKYASSSLEGEGVSAGLGELAQASGSALSGMGFELEVTTPTEQHDGEIKAQGQFTRSVSARLEAELPGVPNGVGGALGRILAKPEIGASGQQSIGGRISLRIPRSAVGDMAAPVFQWVELFLGAQAGGNLASESATVAGEGAMRFTLPSLQAFANQEVDLSDGVSTADLRGMLPFEQLSAKCSVEVASGVTASALRTLLAGDNAAMEFLTGAPSVGGKVEVELSFPTSRIIAQLVTLGLVGDERRPATGPLQDALTALGGLDWEGFLAAVGATGQSMATFMLGSVDKVKVDLYAGTTYEGDQELGGQGASGEISGSLRMRAGYSNEFTRQELASGAAAVRTYLRQGLPAGIASLVD